MSYPSPSDYQEALQVADLALTVPHLAQGVVETNALGLPRGMSGAFAVVFRIDTSVGSKAVRCFLRDQPDRGRHYSPLQAKLEDLDLPYFVDLAWYEQGIQVHGKAYPLLVMEWVEGVTLSQYVETHRHDSQRLAALSSAWRCMLQALDAAQIAHGDLQHGNVLVEEDEAGRPRLRLVDYDGVQFPGQKRQHAQEVGHRHYQHPDRTEQDAGPRLDRFAGLVVATALSALVHDPSLWDRYATGENMLFRADDFYDPVNSPLFEHLTEVPGEDVSRLARALVTACLLPPSATPSLDDALAGSIPHDVSHRRPHGAEPSNRTPQRLGAKRHPIIQVFAASACAIVAVWQPLALVPACVFAAVGLLVGGLGWQRDPDRRRRRRLGRELRVLSQWVADLDAEAERMRLQLHAAFEDRDAQRQQRLAELQVEALHRQLRHHFVSELDHFDGVGHRAVVRLKAAGIRDAAMVTSDAIAAVTRVSGPTKVRIAQWRAALARQYADDVPQSLSPAEEHRLRRRVERARADAEGELRRIEAKAQAQRAERDAVADRLRAIPTRSFVPYLNALVRVRP
ncbi:MAG: AarF/UbiB family protein [Bacteroidota bacterium]